MKSIKSLIILVVCLDVFGLHAQRETNTIAILERFAKDYENDVTFKEDVVFAVKVDNAVWNVNAVAKTDSSRAKVLISNGWPEEPTFYFVTDKKTLANIDSGKLNPLTGAVKEFSSDFAPFDADFMQGFSPDEGFMGKLLSIYFHFWTRGTPEIIPYGIDFTRFTHGSQASVLFYQPGFRSGYVALKKGQHANENEKSRRDPFYSMLISLKGNIIMIIDGKESILKEGNAVVIPPNVSHEFLNRDSETPVEGILLMFGDGA